MYASVAACVIAVVAISASMIVDAAPTAEVEATLALKCTRDIDLTLMSDYQLSSYGSKLAIAIDEDCELNPDDILASENVTAVDSQVLGVEFVDETALTSFENCLNEKKVRFKRCSVVSVRPTNPCASTIFTTAVSVSLRKVPLSKQINDLADDELQILASKFHEATVDKCELDFCDVKAFTPEDISPTGTDSFSVLVRSASVLDSLQDCKFRFMRMIVDSIDELGTTTTSTTSTTSTAGSGEFP
jgi:hypothetical protein